MDELLAQHAPLVRSIANQMVVKLPANVERDDLIQVGMVGLWQAIHSFDAAFGVSFETHARARINGAMLDELRAMDWASRGARRHQRSIDAAQQRLEQRNGRAPRESEVARELGMTLHCYQKLLAKVRGAAIVYLEDIGSNDGDEDFLDRHPDAAAPCPSEALAQRQAADHAAAAMARLPPRLARMVEMRCDEGLTLDELGAIFGVTESRVCQMLQEAARRLTPRPAPRRPPPPVLQVQDQAPPPPPLPPVVREYASVRWG